MIKFMNIIIEDKIKKETKQSCQHDVTILLVYIIQKYTEQSQSINK